MKIEEELIDLYFERWHKIYGYQFNNDNKMEVKEQC